MFEYSVYLVLVDIEILRWVNFRRSRSKYAFGQNDDSGRGYSPVLLMAFAFRFLL